MSSSGVSMRGWRHRNLAMAATARSLSSSELMCILWPGDAGSFLESRCSAKGRAKRGAGASRRKKTPQVIDRIAHLLKHETAGDPMHGLKWTRKTTRNVAQELRQVDIRISAKTVGRLLKHLGFSLRVNHKNLESGNKNPPPREVRNRQFKYINRKRKEFASAGDSIISVDTKKKEKVGNFKNPGTSWQQDPYVVNDHDFSNDAVGMAIPYGIYDTEANRGF